jgi:hypothetical protein
MPCLECNLPDPYNGGGDGIGPCECPRCDECGAPPLVCYHDEYDDYPEWPEDVIVNA